MATVAALPPRPSAAVSDLLDTLDPEQRAAATLPDGPAQVIAPAGSGKTTTLIARLGVLVTRGVPAERIAVVTFNREAAAELSARIASRLGPALPGADRVEVRTLHALARQVLLDAGDPVNLLADRLALLRAARRRVMADRPPDATPMPDAATLDTLLSAWKVEGRAPPEDALPALAVFHDLLATRGALDFGDLVVRAADLLERMPRSGGAGRRASATWRWTSSRTSTPRSCAWCASWPNRSETCSWWATTASRSSQLAHTRWRSTKRAHGIPAWSPGRAAP